MKPLHLARMLTLDELASDWLAPRSEEDFALPAITNFHGMVQAAWGISGIQNWICPPTGMSTPIAVLYENTVNGWRRFSEPVEYRWKAYEIERRSRSVTSSVRMPAGKNAVIGRLRFERAGEFALAFGGLPRVWRFTDYWNLPPEDVPMLNVLATPDGFVIDDTKTFGRAEIGVAGVRRVYADLATWLEGGPASDRGRAGIATFRVKAGDEITWSGVQGCEVELATPDPKSAWASARDEWSEVWQAAFTPGNAHFSGHLPVIEGELERLYSMSVLSLLMCRRKIAPPTSRAMIATGGQCIWNSDDFTPLRRAYVWGGPEGGMTTLFLWELEFQAPLLARLDPEVLRAELEAVIRVDLHRYWGVETTSGRGAGMAYGVNPGAFLSCVSDYVRVTGDERWALDRIDTLKSCCRPGLTDCGSYENILECVASYEHAIAAFNALNVKGLRFVAGLCGDADLEHQADELAREVLTLYADGPFACIQPGGERRVVRTILDFVYVGRSLGEDLPPHVKRGMVEFFERELMTRDWLRALSPEDADALTPRLPSFQRFRADHQATGSYDGWPALAASVLLRFGERDMALAWLKCIQELTREGPFGQAHFIHPDGARKASFFNGNVYFESAGCAFATTLIEDSAER